MVRIGIFASGEGTNVQRFVDYFKDNSNIQIALVVCNNSKARVLERAAKAGIPILLLDKETFYNSEKVVDELLQKVDFIVLAGFLWMIPQNLITAFHNKMVNIHPALLPAYGGKGMYGMRVHEAVIQNKERESGISIHYVNEHYDEGEIILQTKVAVSPAESAETLASKVRQLEHQWYPKTIEKLLS